jgi:hypothetical protein
MNNNLRSFPLNSAKNYLNLMNLQKPVPERTTQRAAAAQPDLVFPTHVCHSAA